MPGPGGGDFLERLLGDLLGLMGRSAAGTGNQMELARTFAQSVASGGEPEANVEPVARIQLEELLRIAELHVSEITGMSVTADATLEVLAVGPGSWAWHTIEDWRFVLDAMSAPASGETDHQGEREESSTAGGTPSEPGDAAPGLGLTELGRLDEAQGDNGGPAEMMARFMTTMGPMLASMQLGSAVGHLARTTLGQYELPVPRPAGRLLIVPQNLESFADDWSLPHDQVRLWVCLREVTANAVLAKAHVQARFRELITEVVRGMAEDTSGIVNKLGEFDLSDPMALQGLLGDPEAMLGAPPTPSRKRASEDLGALTAALVGYIEHVLDEAATRLLGGRSALAEAWRRRQRDRESADRAAELLLGLDLGSAQLERGTEFVRGVLERAGTEGLAKLWSSERSLPTPAEVDAPGLWLERINLPEEP